MADVDAERTSEELSKGIDRVVWGLLLVWAGAVLLLGWGWGAGFLGAGAILLGAQVVRRVRRLPLDGFGLAVGTVFVICGAGSLFDVAVDLFPVLCIVAGVALLVSSFTGKARRAAARPADLPSPSHPRA